MQDVKLTLGTKENLVVDVRDELGVVASLDGASITFDWRLKGDDLWKGQNLAATNEGMRVFCLIDTSTWNVDKIGKYELYIRFTNAPEVPRLGPYDFRIDE